MTSGPMETRVAKFLFHYRLMPHSSTGCSPTELLLGRCPMSLLDALRPNVSERVRCSQERQKLHHSAQASLCQYKSEDSVFVCNFSQRLFTKVWLPGQIVAACGPLSYLIRLVENHQIAHHHVDRIRTRPARIMSYPSIARNDDVYSDFRLHWIPILPTSHRCLLLCHVVQVAIDTLLIGGLLLKRGGDVMYWTCHLGSHVQCNWWHVN